MAVLLLVRTAEQLATG